MPGLLYDPHLITWRPRLDSMLRIGSAGAARTSCGTGIVPQAEDGETAPAVVPIGSSALPTFLFSFTKPEQGVAEVVDQTPDEAVIPFEPSACLFFTASNRGADPGDLFDSMAFGAGLVTQPGTRQARAAHVLIGGNGGSQDSHCWTLNDAVIGVNNAAHYFILPAIVRGDLLSYNDRGDGTWGITIRWAAPRDGVGGFTSDVGGDTIWCLPIGGESVEDVALVSWGPTVAGGPTIDQDITSVGFQPDVLLSLVGIGNADTIINGMRFGLGFANCALEQAACYTSSGHFVGTTDNSRWQREGDAFVLDHNIDSDLRIELLTMLSNGWRHRIHSGIVGPFGNTVGITTLAIKGLSSAIGTVTQGATSVPVSGLRPTAFLMASVGALADANHANGTHRLSVGLAQKDGDQMAAGEEDPDGVSAASETVQSMETESGVLLRLEDGDVTAAAAVTAMPHGAVRLNWTEDDGDDNESIFCALGTGGAGTCAGVGPTPSAPTEIECIIRPLCPEEEEP